MSRIKQPHLVPKFYLRFFENKSGKIFAYDKETNNQFPSTADKICRNSGFYDIDSIEDPINKQIIEHNLSDLETETSLVYDQIIQDIKNHKFGGFTDEIRSVLSKFILIQMRRTQESRVIGSELNNEIKRQIIEKSSAAEAKDILENFDEFDPKSQQLYNLLSSFENPPTELIDRVWVVHKNCSRHKFYTSDNPVVGIDLGKDFKTIYQISIPLTPNYVLSIYIRKQIPEFVNWDNQIIDLDLENIKFYNSLILNRSNRQIYSCENDFRFAKKILEENPEMRNPYRRRI
ncbi:DUF4238 domain-containing protein [Cyclobacterium sp. 1_MG-2023]|uniref:DUF4238 domain-containing protein n=1 Tax=Cyclobacterium sp. 1_MG-2023 TaxID=3062681 RepID=UPI0026E39A3A|nr:DUF4238 domain-containing protein [Cyclobacterium sp. 1_MG-2023]MDO6440492.1 DUF4238 domain-containing protein [Cyclobacterium sp. 1_MG-2023]